MGFFSRFFGRSSEGELPPAEEEKIFSGIRESAARQRMLQATRLNNDEEATAERIKKLLLSASWNESRNRRAYEALSEEMKRLGEKFQVAEGKALRQRVIGRVEVLCGEHFAGLSKYLELLGDDRRD